MSRTRPISGLAIGLATGFGLALAAAGCADSDSPGTASPTTAPVVLTLLTYSSFPTSDTTLNEALATFTADTQIGVSVIPAGDAGTMASKATLSAGNPEGDVMWGIDNTLLSRVLDANVFDPYESPALPELDPALTALVPGREVTPVDFGDVCVNYDIAWFAARQLDPPDTFADLADPALRDLLVVENPASSSTGLAFMLATIAEFGTGESGTDESGTDESGTGEQDWLDYWDSLVANGVEAVESWDIAYYERFSGSSGGGPRPLVVSYASSPPAEVLFADPPRSDAPTAVVAETCFRQVEFAGVLRGGDHPDEARQLVDFLVSNAFQTEVPLNLFVWPARRDVVLPQVFIDHSEVVADPLTIAPGAIAADRETWVDQWTAVVIR